MKKIFYTLIAAILSFTAISQTSISTVGLKGSGTAGKIAMFSASKTLTNSVITQTVNNIGVNDITPIAAFSVKSYTNYPVFSVQAYSVQENTNPLIKAYKSDDTELFRIHSDDKSNLFIGYLSGNTNSLSVSTGYDNTGLGYGTLSLNTTGRFNTALGSQSLNNNTTGQLNTSVGFGALLSNTTGSFNEAFGYQALQSNTTGTDNSAFGYLALNKNTTAMLNSAFGHNALTENTTGTKNSAFGANSLSFVTTGNFNTAVGQGALYLSATGSQNCAFGLGALTNNNGDGNVSIGFQSGYYETGSNKLFIDNQPRGGEADARIKALIYGVFNSNPDNQNVRINAILNLPARSTPGSPDTGDVYSDGTHIYCYLGGSWKQLDN